MINKYSEIDKLMAKAFREYGPVSADLELPSSTDVEYKLVPGKYSSFQEEYRKEVVRRLEEANNKRILRIVK
jgi:hypothetical protein